jgi:UDPglucose--hexose-1-phosphate uridylyltransferase
LPLLFRTNPITGERVLFAPERAARRNAFGDDSDERCPFCPGHESDTPPEVARLGRSMTDPWRVRVFPNKYPPTGGAEVIVESPRHEESFASVEHAENVVSMYVERCRAHADAAYVSLFKNEGHARGRRSRTCIRSSCRCRSCRRGSSGARGLCTKLRVVRHPRERHP